MLQFITFVISPVGRWLSAALAVLAVLGVIYGKGHHDASVSIKENIQRESNKAIDKADTARRSAAQRFDAGRVRNDGFLRD